MDTNKKFEEQLRIRLRSEELPFDSSAWEGFEARYSSTDKVLPHRASKTAKRKTLWIMPLLAVLCIAVFNFASKDENNTNHGISLATGTKSSQKNATQVQYREKGTRQKKEIAKEIDLAAMPNPNGSPNTKATTSRIDKKHLAEKQSSSGKHSSLQPKTIDQENVEQDFSGIRYFKDNSTLEKSETNASLFSPRVSNQKTHPLENPNLALGLNESALGTSTTLTDDVTNSSLARSNPVQIKTATLETNTKSFATKSRSTSGEENSITPPLRDLLSTSNIPIFFSELHPDNRLKNYKADNLIIPYKFKKNEFFIGIGYNYSTNTQAEAINQPQQFEPNVLQIGYERRLNLRWAIGIGVSSTYLTNLDMEVTTSDYHLTSTSFEFVEYKIAHSTSTILGLPVYLKFNPLHKRYTLFAGAKLNYLTNLGIKTTTTTNGILNPVIREIVDSRSYSTYVNDYDYALIFGGRYRFWKNLELEARINWGLADISVNSFWGEAQDKTSSAVVAINYKFNW